MIVSVQVKDGDWKKAADRLLILLEEAGRDASLRGAKSIQDVTRAKLEAQHHSDVTDTPSRPGEPPAAISNALAESIDAKMMTEDQAWVGPTGLPYARIQELGGEMHGNPLMIWFREFKGGIRRITAEFVELPPRPYLEPATRDVIDSGLLREIYIEHWAYAIEEGG